MPPQQFEPLDGRLARLRGPQPPQPYTARKITALTANPACARRAVLDAAGVDKALLAQRVGYEPRFGQSPFALAREQAFHGLVRWGGYAELIRLLREQLSVPVAEAHATDLNEVGGNTALHVRERETRRLIAHVASGEDVRLILDRPVLTLDVASQKSYLEPDALTHRINGMFYVVVIRSFAAIDGQANPAAVAEAAKQAAVYVLALRHAFETAGLPTDQISHKFLLVCPKDFSNRPYGRLIDLRQELDALQFQLSRLHRAEDLAARLPDAATLDTSRSPDELSSSIQVLDASYKPSCLSFCEMARYCRDEADGCASPSRLGSGVRNDLPGIDSTRTALDYLDGVVTPGEAEAEAADLLRDAARLRRLRRGAA
ncbi:hypothetical protein [Streptomyces sp. AA0539]|uniref:hypothetical protein n=1 Tax=Streptomyces sp. AA0539 TaxID=1210045 RepID=UPI0002EE89F5|nr:hypothetical protein [Streptomyces sp. AA0539]